MLWILRIGLYIQLLLGAGRLLGQVGNQRLWETHVSIGVLVALLALWTLRPTEAQVGAGLRRAARWGPLVTLLIGLSMYFGIWSGGFVLTLHVVLGIATVGLVEAAAGQQRRAQRRVERSRG